MIRRFFPTVDWVMSLKPYYRAVDLYVEYVGAYAHDWAARARCVAMALDLLNLAGLLKAPS